MYVNAMKPFREFDEVAGAPKVMSFIYIDETKEVGDIWPQEFMGAANDAGVGRTFGGN